jgi:hypothetical protein
MGRFEHVFDRIATSLATAATTAQVLSMLAFRLPVPRRPPTVEA